MCGICGLISSKHEVDHSVVHRMNDALSHRGPDGEGKYDKPHLSMAMRRLSIIDLDGGWQPIYNEDNSIAIIANGEIYNYIELRLELEAKGHIFSTHSDIETIVHLYEENGLDCVKSLRGMFAFALWDEKRKRMLLARDRMGEKPLYLWQGDGEMIFASEMKALLTSRKIKFEFDALAVHYYFHYQYVPEPLTPLKGVRKLPAGHTLVIDTEPWHVKEQCYWRMQDLPPVEGNPVDLIRKQLEDVSSLIIRSDVPVGVALSGGLDSSIIAALVVKKYPGIMHAFSVGYPGRPMYDERQRAHQLALQLKMPFHEIELSTDEQAEFFDELVYWQDDPIADISGYGYYAVSRKAREEGIPVLLQGQGGDELFWGYEWVRQSAIQSLRKQALLNGHATILDYLQFSRPDSMHPGTLAKWALQGMGIKGWREFFRDRNALQEQLVFMELTPDFSDARQNISSYYSNAFNEKIKAGSPTDLYKSNQPWSDVPVEITRLISQTYLLENGIAQGDRLSMSNSVELRLPFADYRLVETVIGLRRQHPDQNFPVKHWLKESVKDLLPAELLQRRKLGFQPPVHEWHQNAFERHGKLLCDGWLVNNGILAPTMALELSHGPFPKTAISPISFKALVLEIWARHMSNRAG